MKYIIILWIIALMSGCAQDVEFTDVVSTGPLPETTTVASTTTVSPVANTEPTTTTAPETQAQCRIVMFHNGKGPMCLEQLEFLEDIREDFPGLVVEEHLTTDRDSLGLLYEAEAGFSSSIGVSESFGYLPISFISNNAYSGFDRVVEEGLRRDIEVVCR